MESWTRKTGTQACYQPQFGRMTGIRLVCVLNDHMTGASYRVFNGAFDAQEWLLFMTSLIICSGMSDTMEIKLPVQPMIG